MLKRVKYIDPEGRKYLVEVPEGYEDMAENGIIVGPPDLTELNLPLEIEVRLNNQLYDREIFTWSDVRRRPDEIKGALMAVLKLDVQKIKEIYKGA